MDHILAFTSNKKTEGIYKLVSDTTLFTAVPVDLSACVPYDPDHKLDDDSWFKIEDFSQTEFCISLLKKDFDSKDYNDLTYAQFKNITHLIAVQGSDFYFQKITPSLFITAQKYVVLGEVSKIEEVENRLQINTVPDALYIKSKDILIFKKLVTISGLFKGIETLYKEATHAEVEKFLSMPFIKLGNNFKVESVSRLNRQRIGLVKETLETMSSDDMKAMIAYISKYADQKSLKFDSDKNNFEISKDSELKVLLYGFQQRFYTTPLGDEKRLANSVVVINKK